MHRQQPFVLLVGSLPEVGLDSPQRATQQPSAVSGGEDQLTICLDPRRTQRVAGLAEALQRLRDSNQPLCDLIVLCEPRPGLWTDRQVAALRSLAPLARLVRLSGSLCEGQARSGRPASGTWHVPWHQWQAFAARELSAADPWPRWSLPLTATPDERALATYRPRPPHSSGHVTICSTSAASAAALAAACESSGYRTSRNLPCNSTTTLLWDTTVASLRDPYRVARLRGTHGDVPIVALAGFPRAEDVAAAAANGIAAVLAKPLDTEELFWHLTQLSREE